jgi:hypothetical protein
VRRFNQLNGGAGEIRTRDNRFRKPMLYPSELQPLETKLNMHPNLYQDSSTKPDNITFARLSSCKSRTSHASVVLFIVNLALRVPVLAIASE